MPPRNESPLTVYNEKFSIKDLIKEIKQKPNDLSSQIEFCRKMAAFATDDSLNVLLAKQEGISHIVKALRSFKNNADLVKAACQTLVKMVTFTDANCVHIYKEDGILLLLDLINIYIDDAELLQIILEILGYSAMSDDTELLDSMLEKSCHTHILTTMSRHGDNREIVKQCCFILSHLVQSVETARSLMFVGGVHVIIGVMQKYKDDNEVLENGCRALGSFAIHDEICTDVVNAGALKIALSALEKRDCDENLLECATWALACLTKYDESCEEMCSSCGLENLVKVMKTYPTTATVQEYGCWTICNIVAHDKTMQENISEDLLEVLLDATRMFLENVDLQEQLLFSLSEILITEESTLTRLMSKNGLTLIIKTMSQYPDHSTIQEHGCRIIGNIAVHENYRRSVEKDGASKVIASAMLTLENCEELQEIGCLALTNITANVNKNKSSAVLNGCVNAVLRAMNNYRNSQNILVSGVQTICNVIEIDEACYNFVEENGLAIFGTILISLGDRHEMHEFLMFASSILSRVSSVLGIKDEYLMKAETLLLHIINLTRENSESVLCLCNFYEYLVQREKGFKLFQDIAALEKVYSWLEKYERDVNIQTCGCKILAAVALYDKDQCKDVFNTMKKCMSTFTEERDIQLICCGALVYIADHNEHFKDYLLQHNAVSMVTTAMKMHERVEQLVDLALMAFDTLLYKNKSITALTDPVEYELIQKVIRKYPDNTEIQIHGCNIFSKLATFQQTLIGTTTESRETCNHIVSLLKRRRSNSELQTAALGALKGLLAGESETVVQNTKEELSFLIDFWG